MRRACLVSVLLAIFAVAPADAAPRTYTVGADVQGAVTARFTLVRSVRFPLDMKVTRPTDVYGMILTRVGDPFGFFVGVKVAPVRPGGWVGVGSTVDHAGVVWPAGTYDLTLFSPTRTRVNLTFENPMPRLRFHARKVQLTKRDSDSNQPVWTDQVDVTITGGARGLFVMQRDEWNGLDRHMQKSCVWHATPCPAVDAEQLATGKNDAGAQSAERFGATAGAVFEEGSGNHVSLTSITGGTVTHRTAVVLVIP